MDQTPDSKPPDATDQATACTAEPAPRPRKRRLRWLVLAHVAISLSTGILVASIGLSNGPRLAVACWAGIVFCQTNLLGIWGGLGTSSWWVRLLGLIAGMGYLGRLLDFCVGGPYRDNHIIVSLATVLVPAGTAAVESPDDDDRACLNAPAQLVWATFHVGRLPTCGRRVENDLSSPSPSPREPGVMP